MNPHNLRTGAREMKMLIRETVTHSYWLNAPKGSLKRGNDPQTRRKGCELVKRHTKGKKKVGKKE